MSDRRPFTITCLHRDPDQGFWRARVTNGTTIDVDRKFGSWQCEVRVRPGARSFVRRDVLPDVAKALQDWVRPIENAEQRESKSAV